MAYVTFQTLLSDMFLPIPHSHKLILTFILEYCYFNFRLGSCSKHLHSWQVTTRFLSWMDQMKACSHGLLWTFFLVWQ